MQILSRPKGEAPADTSAGDHDLTPTLCDNLADAGRPLPMLPEDNQPEEAESGTLQPLQQYAELQFGDREMRPMAAPPNENFDVKYTEISKA